MNSPSPAVKVSDANEAAIAAAYGCISDADYDEVARAVSIALDAYRAALPAFHIVFDGFPAPGGPRFIEVEDGNGKSINAGEWHSRADGLAELVIPIERRASGQVDPVADSPAEQGKLPYRLRYAGATLKGELGELMMSAAAALDALSTNPDSRASSGEVGIDGDDCDAVLAAACRKYNIGNTSRLDEVMTAYRTPSPSPAHEVGEATHRHKKRGTEYVLIGVGKMQSEHWYEPTFPHGEPRSVDMREVAIYRSVDDGSLWVRPLEEFEDGRFDILAAALSGPKS